MKRQLWMFALCIDSALLADDLPIAAYTDRGFAAWLKSTASQ